MNGCLIALEGVHGAGKTTLAKHLIEVLMADRIPVVFSKDQAGTPFSETIRNLNLDALSAVDLYAETFLVAAARRQTYVDVIRPALEQFQNVITERFVDSFFAYGAARGLPIEFSRTVAESTCGGQYPNLTLLLDLNPELGLQRILEAEKHRIEKEDLKFHKKLREGYLKQATDNPRRFIVVDASLPVEKVKSEALAAVRSVLHI